MLTTPAVIMNSIVSLIKPHFPQGGSLESWSKKVTGFVPYPLNFLINPDFSKMSKISPEPDVIV